MTPFDDPGGMTGANQATGKLSPPKVQSRVRRWLGLFLRLVVTGLVTWFILKAVGLRLEELRAFDLSTLKPRWGMLLLSAGVLFLGYLYSAGLWGLMVRELGGPKVPKVAALRIFFTANLGRYLPGKVWQIAGLAYLARGEGVTAPTATVAALLGQAFSLAGATLVGSGVLLRMDWGEDVGGGWAVGAVVTLMVVLTIPAVLKPILRLLFRRVEGADPGPLWPDQAFGLRWVALYAVSWVIQGGAFCLLALGLGMGLDPVHGVAIFPAAYLLGYIAIFAPAGIGVREGFLILFLNPMLGAGGAVVAVIARLWTTTVELVPALLLAGGYVKDSKADDGEGGARA